MEDAKEKRLDAEILDDELEKKILEETSRAIEYNEDCTLRAIEYSKLNISLSKEDIMQDIEDASLTITGIDFNEIAEYSKLKSKLRNIFNSIKLAFVTLIQKGKDRENSIEKMELNQIRKDKLYDSTRIGAQKNNILKSKDNKYETKEMRSIKRNSEPIFYNFEEQEKCEINRKQENSESVEQRKKYINIPNVKGDEPDQELEI